MKEWHREWAIWQYAHEGLQRSGTGSGLYGNTPMKAYRGAAQGVVHMTIEKAYRGGAPRVVHMRIIP